MKTNSITDNLELFPDVSLVASVVSSRTQKGSKWGKPSRPIFVWRNLREIWIGGNLVILALGFATLGILSLTSRHYEGEINGMSNTLVMLSSTISMLFSAAFLVVAWLYWNRPRVSGASQS
jgi:hypothetical protein